MIVIAGVIAGSVYMTLPKFIPYFQSNTQSLYWIIGLGLLARLLLMIPDPFLEIDYVRYFWDGAVINVGFSPYRWSPEQVISGNAPEELIVLAQQSNGLIDQINYPYVSTIYPPLAQAIFALTNWISPWDLMVWKLVILMFDGITAVLLYVILRQIGRPPVWLIIYWWNPIVIVEFSNAAHMDVLLLPFLVGAFYLTLKGRATFVQGGLLACATAVKLWPVLLLPLFIRTNSDKRKTVLVIVSFTIMSTFLLWPFLVQTLIPASGLHAYGVGWENNAALFHILLAGLTLAFDSFGLFDLDTDRVLRTCVGLTIILIALGLNVRASIVPGDPQIMARRIILVIAALLLLGPTMYPWYYTWMVPFLAILPLRSMLIFSAVLPLYRLQFHPWFMENSWVFQDIIVWLEQGPVLILLALECRREWKTDRARSRNNRYAA